MTGREHRSATPDRGSIAVELVFIMPVMLLMLALIYAYGRVAQVNGTLDAGTRDAARAASQARSEVEAQQVAERAVETALGGGPCHDTATVTLSGVFQSGFPITVTSSCTYPLGDLGLLGAPGNVTVSSRFTSPLDPNRGVR